MLGSGVGEALVGVPGPPLELQGAGSVASAAQPVNLASGLGMMHHEDQEGALLMK